MHNDDEAAAVPDPAEPDPSLAQVTGEQMMSTRDLQSAAAGAQLVIMATNSAQHARL
jgi:hypothetical protein